MEVGLPSAVLAFPPLPTDRVLFLDTASLSFEKNQHWLPFIKTASTATPTDSSNSGLAPAGHEFFHLAATEMAAQ